MEERSEIWEIKLGKKRTFAFSEGYRLDHVRDLTTFAKSLPEGIAICTADHIAGRKHLENVLTQAAESFDRGIFLARNRSIDLVMRITGQSQISKALDTSGLKDASRVAVFGLSSTKKQIKNVELLLGKMGSRDDSVLDMNSRKEKLLRQFFLLPSLIKKDQIPLLLSEKSVTLVFPK
ncbi:MAG: KEOPS complex subunit Cgi121 [Nitrososphaerales archaeon]